MSISAGSFVFSVTFMKDILASAVAGPVMKSALLVGWVALAISTVAGIFQMRLWAEFYISWGLHWNKQWAIERRRAIERWRKLADRMQVATFVCGFASLLTFAIWTIALK